MSELVWGALSTSWGWVGAMATPKGLRRLGLPVPSVQEALEAMGPEVRDATLAPAVLEPLRQWLERYLAGEPAVYEEPLDLEGAPPFFHQAWLACRAIPRGQTRTYAWLAAQAGNPAAVRAAGQAMAHNPVSIIIPCHRVIGSDGGLCGYGGGLPMKQRLLDLERPVRA
ncbi:MAG: methylated-DNA--[protein]-cysteine S-methyltransferase [Chloroflexi bacterium]|nr:methylated-DNA--[protein]-cysteine S-methyltransferase [Chloroflexota bacterium]